MFLVIFLVDTLECFWSKKKGDGVGVLGVMFRMKGVFTTTNPLSRSFILWLGFAPNFPLFFCEFRPTGCWALLGATPNQRIKKRESDLVGGKYCRTAIQNPFWSQEKIKRWWIYYCIFDPKLKPDDVRIYEFETPIEYSNLTINLLYDAVYPAIFVRVKVKTIDFLFAIFQEF